MIENGPFEGSDVTPAIEIGVEKNHPAADDGLERNDELHQNADTKRIRRMMQENSSDTILSCRGVDALKVSAVSEAYGIICNITVKNLDELKNLLRAGARLVSKKVGVTANIKIFKEPYWKR